MMKIIKSKWFIIIMVCSIVSSLLIYLVIANVIMSAGGAISSFFAKKQQEEQEINMLSSLENFTITGKEESGVYILTFDFGAWKIEDIRIPKGEAEINTAVRVPSISGSREDMAVKYFVRHGFTKQAACGILANIKVESASTFSSTIEEGSVEEYRGEFVLSRGYGICQWTNAERSEGYGRRYNLIQFLKGKGFTISSDTEDTDEMYLAELEYAITESTHKYIADKIKPLTSPGDAAEIWCREWEIPRDVDAACIRRRAIAEDYYAKYKDMNINSGSDLEAAIFSAKIEVEDGTVFIDGKLAGQDIGASFTINKGSISGSGEYGAGASSDGGIGNPYGSEKFHIIWAALIWRVCPYHLDWELHGGWDFVLGGEGTPLYAVVSGEIVHAGPMGELGNHCVVIKSGDTYVFYGHMCEHTVSVGDHVNKGDRVGSQGNEGASVGAHLHLEFRQGSIWGTTTANFDKIKRTLQRYSTNYNSFDYSEIVR